MRRRRFLAAAGLAAVGFAGCQRLADGPERPTQTTTPPPDTPPTSTPSVSAELDSLQPAVVTLNVDALDVDGEPGRQYCYLDVTVDVGEPPRRDDFRLRFGGDHHPPATIERLWRAYPEDAGRYDRADGEGWVLFDLPATGDASDVALLDADTGGEWPIVAQASVDFDGRLASPAPPLSLVFDGPDRVALGSQPTVTMTVTNDGDRDGTFVGGLNRVGPAVAYAPVEAIRQVVPPDEPTTVTVIDELRLERPADEELGDGNADMTYHLQWTGDRRSHDVRLVEAAEGN